MMKFNFQIFNIYAHFGFNTIHRDWSVGCFGQQHSKYMRFGLSFLAAMQILQFSSEFSTRAYF